MTSFLAHLRDDGRTVDQKEGRDDGKEGHVTVISSTTDTVLGTVVLEPVADTGFLSNGSVLDRIPTTDPPTFTFTTGAFPNLLQGVAIKGGHAYLPNVGSSPNGPFRFNVNVQGLLSVIDTATDVDAGLTLNMNRGVQFENVGQKLFNTTPITIAFKQSAERRLRGPGRCRPIGAGRSGRGRYAEHQRPDRAAAAGDAEQHHPDPGREESGWDRDQLDRHSRLRVEFHLPRCFGRGHLRQRPDALPGDRRRSSRRAFQPPGRRMRSSIWDMSCSTPASGRRGHSPLRNAPRVGCPTPAGATATTAIPTAFTTVSPGCSRTVRGSRFRWRARGASSAAGSQLNANGAPLLPSFKQRVLNWSAVRDEVQDFELNIRAVSGGQGLIRDGQAVVNLTPTANTGRDADLDAIAAYVTQGIRAPISPLRPKNVGGGQPDPDIAAGRALFAAANCQSCHGGPNWTRSRVDFTPPPLVGNHHGRSARQIPRPVGTFDSTAFNEVRGAGTTIVTANGVARLQHPQLALGVRRRALLSQRRCSDA